MPSSKNSVKATSTTAINTADTNATIKRDLSSVSLISNGIAKLSSLTPARDLTLGGRGASTNKKVFLPNLNVVRNKNTNVRTSKDTTISKGRGRGRGADRGTRGTSKGGRGGSSLIQTAGVFSEGAGAANIRQTSRSSGYSRDEEATSAMKKPTLLDSQKKFDIKAALAKDVDILKTLDYEDDDIEEEQKTDLDRMPVQLNETKWKYIKPVVSVAAENTELNEDTVVITSDMQSLHVAEQNKSLPRYPQSLKELLDSSEPQLFLMQLPDTLPCVEDSDQPDVPDNPSTSSSISTAKPSNLTENTSDETAKQTHPTDRKRKAIKDNVLKKMEEGQVGRLIRYKSGKTKLVLGESFFDLDIGMETGFVQDLMSINSNREERSGKMIDLGPIQAKITATPDWEQLLNQSITNDHL